MWIGELARHTGVSTKALRYYEGEGLLREPRRTPAGYRDYDAASVLRVTFIKRAQAAGLTLQQIRELLDLQARLDALDPAACAPDSTCAAVMRA